MKRILKRLNKFWDETQSFTFLLSVLVVYIFVIIPIVDKRLTEVVLFFIFYFLLLSGGIPFLIRNKRSGIIFLLIVSPIVLLFSEILLKSAWITVCSDLFLVLYCISLGTIIMIKTFSRGHITAHRVLGSIICYLLTGLIFAMLYHSIYLLNGNVAFKGLGTCFRTEFMYFSFSTLTTAGYGDITAVDNYARSMSNLESLIGQLYPAILIARLISMEFTNSKDS